MKAGSLFQLALKIIYGLSTKISESSIPMNFRIRIRITRETTRIKDQLSETIGLVSLKSMDREQVFLLHTLHLQKCRY